MSYVVTSTTHPEGDRQEFLTFSSAFDYASELVSLGFSPEMTHYGETFGWDEICERAREHGYL